MSYPYSFLGWAPNPATHTDRDSGQSVEAEGDSLNIIVHVRLNVFIPDDPYSRFRKPASAVPAKVLRAD